MFAACTLVVGLHVADVALIHPGGSDILARGLLLAAAAVTVVAVRIFARAGRLARGLLAACIGLAATVVGLASSMPHALLTGAGGSDYTGVLFTVAGIMLICLAFRTALCGRRRVAQVAFTVLGGFVVVQWLIVPAINAGVATHAPRPSPASAATLRLAGARDVTFPARDGVRLSGWYVPGRNRAAVILLHGSHGTRTDTVPYLRMLAARGYAVLAYDARGHGSSAGQTNALGWLGADDLAGAVTFLARQPGVDGRKIAALGLSMGAEEALRAAATGVPIAAVVADGAGASTLGDSELVPHGLQPVFASVTWLTMRAVELASGETEPAPLNTILPRVHIPVLLIASKAANERATDQAFRASLRQGRLWYLSDVGHTGGLNSHPDAYAARVSAFLRQALTQP